MAPRLINPKEMKDLIQKFKRTPANDLAAIHLSIAVALTLMGQLLIALPWFFVAALYCSDSKKI
jgi:hypothetical protein